MPKHSIISVRKQYGIREYEDCIKAILRRDGVSKIEIPRSISYGGALGVSVSFAQLISTWASSSSSRYGEQILTTLPSNDNDAHERFVSRLHGLTAAYYACSVTGQDKKIDLRRKLLKAAAPRISAMSRREFSRVSKGRMAELIFVHGAQHQFHSAVYSRVPEQADLMDPQLHGELIVSPREMSAMVEKILKELKLRERDMVRLIPFLENKDYPIGQLLHETFRNTAEHAYLDLDGRIPQKGIRTILIAYQELEPDHLRPETLLSAEHHGAKKYFDRLRMRANLRDRNKIHILELSVFDTGPGFADTISKYKEFDNCTEAEYVSHCFNDHVSCKGGPNSGLGLGRVLSLVRHLEGFIRVRTSTTEIFYSSESQYIDSKQTAFVVGYLPKVTGTVITIAVPLKF